MIDRDWFWPKDIVPKIIAIILYLLFSLRFVPEFDELAFKLVSYFIILISVLGITFYFLFYLLKLEKQREIAEAISSPIIGSILIFTTLFWLFKINEGIFIDTCTQSAIIAFGLNLLFVTGFEGFLSIKNREFGEISFRLTKGFNKRFESLTYFSKALIPTILFMSMFFIPFYIIKSIISNDINIVLDVVFLVPYVISCFLLIYYRTEIAFWLIVCLLIINIAISLFFLEQHGLFGWHIMLYYGFMLVGLSVVYTLNSIKQLSILSSLLLIPIIVFIILGLNNTIGNVLLEKIIVGIVIPLLTSVGGAFLGYYLSKRKQPSQNNSLFYSPEDCEQILNISKKNVYKLLNNGILKGVKVGRNWIIKEGDLNNYKNSVANTR